MTRGNTSQFSTNHPNHPTVGYAPGTPAPTLAQVSDFLDFSSYQAHDRITILLWELITHVRQLEYENHELRARL